MIIFVDDDSNDGSHEILNFYLKKSKYKIHNKEK